MTPPVVSRFHGGCACKAFRYSIDGPLGFSFHCQCRDCQYLSGTGHTSAFIVKRDKANLMGELTWFERKAPSGNSVISGFCGTCGSTVVTKNTGYPENLFFAAASLDDPSHYHPSTIVHRDEGVDWDFVDPEK